MYSNVSDEFLQEVVKKTQIRSYRCQVQYWDAFGTEKIEVLDAEEWELGSTEIDASCLPSSIFELGGTVAASVSSTLKNDSLKWKGCKFVGGYIRPYFGLKVNGEFEWVPIGWFVVDSCSKTSAKAIKITAVDSIVRAEKLASVLNITYPATLLSIAQACAAYIGSSLSTTNFYGANLTINAPSDLNAITVRDLIGGIAAVAGGFARINESNELEFVTFSSSPSAVIKGDEIRFSCDVGEPNTIDSIVYYGSEVNQIAGSGDGRNPITISENPVFENLSGGKDGITEILQHHYTTYNGLKIVPCDVSYAGNPCIQAGDTISLPANIDGDTITIATSIRLGITTTSSISCVDCDPISSDFYSTKKRKSGNDGLSMSQVNGAIDNKLDDFKDYVNSVAGGCCNPNLLNRQFYFSPMVMGTDGSMIKYNQTITKSITGRNYFIPCTSFSSSSGNVRINMAAYNLDYKGTYTISFLCRCRNTPAQNSDDFALKHQFSLSPARNFAYNDMSLSTLGTKTLGTISIRNTDWDVVSLTFTAPLPANGESATENANKNDYKAYPCHVLTLSNSNFDQDLLIQQIKLEKGDKFTGFDVNGGTEENLAISGMRSFFDWGLYLSVDSVHGTCPPGDNNNRIQRWIGLDDGELVTSNSPGLMSPEDKNRLDNLSESASINRITNAQIDALF